MNNENGDIYSLNELISCLEQIRDDGEGLLNFPKAFYCLAKEIEKLSDYQTFLHELIPLKYKKFFFKEGENPFFSLMDFKAHESKQAFEDAKKRMKTLLEKSKPNSSEAS